MQWRLVSLLATEASLLSGLELGHGPSHWALACLLLILMPENLLRLLFDLIE